MGNSALSPLSLLSLPAFFVERTDVLFSLSGCQQFECERALGGRESRSWLEGPEMGSCVASNPSPFSAWTRMASVNTLATAMTAAAGHAATPVLLTHSGVHGVFELFRIKQRRDKIRVMPACKTCNLFQ